MGKGILDPTIGALNTSLNLRLANQNVISSNIANADTPGFRAKEVNFEQAFRDALQATRELAVEGEHVEHFAPSGTEPVNPEIYEVPNDVFSLDGNNVNRAEEMAKLQENQLLYEASVDLLKKKLATLKYAVSDGGAN